MEYVFLGDHKDKYQVALLSGSSDVDALAKHYLEPAGVTEDTILVELLNQGKKTPKKVIREYWDSIKPELIKMGIKTLLVADVEYFKHIINETKAEAYLGIKCDTEDFSVFYLPNYRALFYNPEGVQAKLSLAVKSVKAFMEGSYKERGKDIIKTAVYIHTKEEAVQWFEKLNSYEALTSDIEATGLKYYQDNLLTIGFAWNQNEGVVFKYGPYLKPLLKKFFQNYKGKKIFHNAAFDVTFLIYHLWMQGLVDQKGLLEGLEICTKNIQCTQLTAYLALNSCADIELGLKPLSHEYTGNYAVDLKDPSSIPIPELMKYNLIDCLATWFVYNRYNPMIAQDNQKEIFCLFHQWLRDVIQMQLTGMPLNMKRVQEVKAIISKDAETSLQGILNSPAVQKTVNVQKAEWVLKKNATLKKKRVTEADAVIEFNPDSPDQLQMLLFDILQFPILDLTDTKQPATGKKTLKALKNHTQDPEVIQLLDHLLLYKDASKILEAFIPAFEAAPYCEELGCHMLMGNFRLGGTKSGRLSSNNVNLQQLPSGGRYGKLIKSCFQAPEGWLFVGLDFDSLEDRISALTTKDPNKLKVYTDGFDGHCLRAYSYFTDQMPLIASDSVEDINSIEKLYPNLRQESKAPTFALTYGGTFKTLMRNLGWTKDKSTEIESRFKQLYKVSVEWVADKIKKASTDGYVTGAFGLRLRTPIIAQTVLGARATPFEAEAEARTAGNMLGQSYCMLNSRAANEFMEGVRTSEYKHDILACAQIHDASYYLIRADVKILKHVNDNLVKAAYWQELPEIKHPEVTLGGTLGVFHPSWEKEHEVPKYASIEELLEFGEEVVNAT